MAASEPILSMIHPAMINLVLVRHGQADGVTPVPGLIGTALSPLGSKQANRVAQRLAVVPFDALYCSDMARAHQTALEIHRHHPKAPLMVDPDIQEISSFQVRDFPHAKTKAEREKLHQQRERVTRFAQYLGSNHKPGEVVGIIAHNGLNGMLMGELARLKPRETIRLVSSHTGVTFAALSTKPSHLVIRLMGCTRHLTDSQITFQNLRHIGPPNHLVPYPAR